MWQNRTYENACIKGGGCDQDSILARVEGLQNNRPERIRLNGIDCPEKGQAYGTRAKQAASALVFGKEVTLQTHGLDKYGRTIADVFLPDGTNVNHTLVKDGWCWWYGKYAPGNVILEELERRARGSGIGLWADSNPVSPWEWQKARRGQSLDLSDLVPLNSETESSGTSRGPLQLGAVQPDSSPDSTSYPSLSHHQHTGPIPGNLLSTRVVPKAIPLQYGRDFTVSINLRNSFFLLTNHRSIQWGSEVPPLFIKALLPRFPSGLAGFPVETTRTLSVAMQPVQSSVLSVPAPRGFYSQPTAAWRDSV